MAWRDRDGEDPYDSLGRPGGDWQGVRPSLDNPMSWSLPIGRVARIAVRIHVVFVIYVVGQLARSLVSPHAADVRPLSTSLVALNLGVLFGVVLLHEFGHCFACRWVRGEANEILMWPLGGLAFCRPPQHWRAHLVTAAGGPMVNVVIFLVLAPVLAIVTGHVKGVAIPNPLGPLPVFPRESWWLLTLFTIHDVSFLLLLFNLLPIFPLDGGRLCQACLWPRFGYVRSMRLAVYTGYFGAIALGLFGWATGHWMLLAIAAFGGITCYLTLKQLEFTDAVIAGGDYGESLWDDGGDREPDPGWRERRAEKKAQRLAAEREAEAAEIDRILAKIGDRGVDGLDSRERTLLQKATERRRREES